MVTSVIKADLKFERAVDQFATRIIAENFLRGCRRQAAKGILEPEFVEGYERYTGMRVEGDLRNHVIKGGGYAVLKTSEREVELLGRISALSRRAQKTAYRKFQAYMKPSLLVRAINQAGHRLGMSGNIPF